VTTQDNTALRQRLVTLLVTETQQLMAFVSILEQEREILTQSDVEPLFEMANSKAILARQLQQLANSRAAVLSQAGLSHTREGAENLLGGKFGDIWQQYLKLAAQARDMNEHNGRVVTHRLAANHQALEILLAYSDQPAVYGPDGTSRLRPGSRHLGSV